MNQIKLERQNSVNQDHPSPKYKFEEVFVVSKKIKNNAEQSETIEPWMEYAQSNPFLQLKSQQSKKYTSNMKRYTSEMIFKNWKSSEKHIRVRESKKIPVLDIGELNCIRRTVYPIKVKNVLSSPSSIESEHQRSVNRERTLSSVKQQLNIERKLFILSNSKSNILAGPQMKSSRIRTIINNAKL